MKTFGNIEFGYLTSGPLSQDLGEQCFNLDQSEIPFPWKLTSWLELQHPPFHLFVAHEQEYLVGLGLFSLLAGDFSAHLLKIAVRPAFYGTGLAVSFWHYQQRELQKIGATESYLEVAEQNVRAVRFYEKLGFTRLRHMRGFYSDGRDALGMRSVFNN